MVYVDAEDLPEELGRVLRVVQDVAGAATVAESNVEISVGTEPDHPAVVVVGRSLLQREQDLLGRFVERLSAVGGGEARDRRGQVELGAVMR